VRVPTPPLIQKLLRLIVTFVLGMIIGSIIFLYMHGQIMENLLLENRHLDITNTKLNEDIQGLNEDKSELSKRYQQKLVIKKIEIEIVEEDGAITDGFTETDISERLRKDLKFLINMPLESVAETSDTIRHLVNGRLYDINQQQYGLELETLIIFTTLKLKVSVHKTK
jgi:hypothetical protein